MIKIPCHESHYWMDGILKRELDLSKKMLREDWDRLFIVDGYPGTGKSVFTQQCAYYVSDGKFTSEHICFNAKQFRSAVLNAKPYTSIVFDESFRGFAGRAALSKTNKMLVALLNEIRQKNLVIFIVIPSFWDLDKYVTLHRCSGVFHVKALKHKTKDGNIGLKRGYVDFFNKGKIQYIVGNSSKRYVYPQKRDFYIQFKKYYPVPEDEYKKKKGDALGEYAYQDEEDKNKRIKLQRGKLVKELSVYLSTDKIGEKIGVSGRTVRDWRLVAADKKEHTPQEGESESLPMPEEAI